MDDLLFAKAGPAMPMGSSRRMPGDEPAPADDDQSAFMTVFAASPDAAAGADGARATDLADAAVALAQDSTAMVIALPQALSTLALQRATSVMAQSRLAEPTGAGGDVIPSAPLATGMGPPAPAGTVVPLMAAGMLPTAAAGAAGPIGLAPGSDGPTDAATPMAVAAVPATLPAPAAAGLGSKGPATALPGALTPRAEAGPEGLATLRISTRMSLDEPVAAARSTPSASTPDVGAALAQATGTVLQAGADGADLSPVPSASPAQGSVAPMVDRIAPTDLPLHTTRQIATALAAMPQEPGGAVDIALDPPELGRLRLSLSELNGVMTLSITAERPETADLIRRHLVLLADEFTRQGLDAPSVDISNGGGQQGQDARAAEMPAASEDAGADSAPPLRATVPMSLVRLGVGGGLDLRL